MYDCVELSCRHYKGPEDGGHIDSDVNGVLPGVVQCTACTTICAGPVWELGVLSRK